MCGIAGLVDHVSPPERAVLESMSLPLAKRGPDDLGLFTAGDAALVHRRLSIIDLNGGHQPIFNEDRSLAIVVNGEIYDFARYRQDLIAKGHRFSTGSDSEVALHLYEEYGDAMPAMLNGMFALAILHVASGELFLARDRFGKKPLFYAVGSRRFAFASGPQSLRVLPWVDATLDAQSVYDYLELQYIPGPASIYCGIRKMPPGHWARWRDGQLTLTRYWQPMLTGTFDGTYADACRQLQQTMAAAVSRRLVADVPVGVFLSGGMDSSIVCALSQQLSGKRIQSFSIGFPEKKFDERQYAKLVAEHVGTDHHFLEVNPDDFSRLSGIVGDYEEPFCDASMLPSWLLCEFTRQHVTVALSGDGADELFGGYYRYRVMHLLRLLDIVPPGLRGCVQRALLKILPPKVEERTFWGRLRRLVELGDTAGCARYRQLISRCPDPLKQTLAGERISDGQQRSIVDFLRGHGSGREFATEVDGIMELDMRTYLCDDILVKVDRASMAHGLEVRSPFLDADVANLALRLPYAWKQNGRRRKKIVEDSFGNLLPAAIFSRPKMGFGVPIARWFRGSWRSPAGDLLLSGSRIAASGLIRQQGIEDLWQSHQAERMDGSYTLFALLVLELWLRGADISSAATRSHGNDGDHGLSAGNAADKHQHKRAVRQ